MIFARSASFAADPSGWGWVPSAIAAGIALLFVGCCVAGVIWCAIVAGKQEEFVEKPRLTEDQWRQLLDSDAPTYVKGDGPTYPRDDR